MDKHFLRCQSIIVRLLIPILAVLLIQALLFAITILCGGTTERLTNNAFDILNERLLARKNYLSNEITQRWCNLSEAEEHIQNEIENFRHSKNISQETFKENSQLQTEFLRNITNYMAYTLRQRTTTGLFLIFEGNSSHERQGIYIRDLDPLFNPADNADILIERGSSSVARKLHASLDSRWASHFDLTEGSRVSDFYFKPFSAAKQYKQIAAIDLGYWSRPFRLSGDDIEVITYSIPLIDSNGKPYGVLGIEINLDYLSTKLPYDELAGQKQGSYLLAISQGDNQTFENVLVSGPLGKRLIASDTYTDFYKTPIYNNIYTINKKNGLSQTTYGCVQFFDLYNSNTPFESDRWALIGMIEKNHLLSSTKQVQLSVIVSLLLSLVIGILGVMFTGTWFVYPITALAHKVRQSDPEKPIKLDKTNIIEIDQLACAIENLSANVADSASKLSQIIDMVNLPIGAFEYTKGQSQVFCTKAFFNIIGVETQAPNSQYVSTAFFNEAMNYLIKHPESDLDHTYRCEDQNGKIRWVRLQTQENNGKTLGVVEDITKETISKRKIEYERDHDLLTNLLNRRAFHSLVCKKMESGNIETAAIILWDLDNLKYINDTYGHDYGDQYIRTAATILNEFTVYKSIVARMSGDEFYTFIYGYKDRDSIRNILNAIQEKLHNTVLTMPDGDMIKIRASAGVAWYPDDSIYYDQLLKYSDFAMYEIKNTVKGNIGEFDKTRYSRDSFLLHGKEELNKLIEEDLVRFAFQPIVDAVTGEIFAYEALMRPQLETVKTPLDIIRLAHSQSKLYEIERITWFKAMEAFEENKNVFGNAKIFINSIPNHVMSEKDLEQFERIYKDDLSRIVIEIIENEQTNEQFAKMKHDVVERWNSQLALDDFGAGYNSEIALLALSPDFIKIDMSIVRGIDKDLNRQKLLQNCLSYAQGRHMKVIAEGVENKKEMDTLIAFGVDYMQGFYFGRPSFKPQKLSSEIIWDIRNERLKTL